MLDYIVVGSGIGSFCICKRLADEQKSFTVISDFHNSATSVAGGIINPIILKRFKPFWNALDFYNQALHFYNDLQLQLDVKVLLNKEILRIFSSIEEQNNWYSALDKPVLNRFLTPNLLDQHDQLISNFKVGQMQNAFLVDAKKILTYFHNSFLDKSSYYNCQFDYSKLIFGKDIYQYEGLLAKKIIFTEGSKAIFNPFFSYLPIYGNRGDYLIFKSSHLNIDKLVKGKEFLIPLGNGFYKFGATFDRNNLSNEAPVEYQNSLIRSLKSVIKSDFEVIRFESGIRPNTKDRRPVLGQHPVHKDVYIMNGFGSRGMFMSPLLSKWLYNHIENDKNLPQEINIKRFQSYF
mgnify:CR=1 FL=1